MLFKTYFVEVPHDFFALIIVDMNEAKKAGEQIKFQAFLLENINCAIGATDFNGRYIYWNKHMETLFHWKKEEVLGRHMLEIRLTEDMKASDFEMFERIKKDGYMEFETNCPRKDRTSFPAHVIVASLKDENGNIMALVGIHTDISEQKKLEAALKESNERWQYALEGSGD
ncbi:MAG TPA: PAS domain S-box protein, partial [Candidatus Wallbacteria bacterium]|nr:PAS domain S-box protein [Candidatus Wallbacteria bacterium]